MPMTPFSVFCFLFCSLFPVVRAARLVFGVMGQKVCLVVNRCDRGGYEVVVWSSFRLMLVP